MAIPRWGAMQITVKSDIGRIRNLPNAINKQFRFAAPRALNDTAFKGREALKKHAKQVFSNTVYRTENAGQVEKATRGKLTSRLYLREDTSVGIQPGKYLRAEIQGGGRRDKRLEKALRATMFSTKKRGAKPVLPEGYYAVPHPSITNKRDNLTAARAKAIIADMKQNGRGKKYFVIHPSSIGGSGVTPGIYYRVGKNIRLAIVFVPRGRINYSPKYKFYAVGGAAFKRWFPIYMRKYFEGALKTMRV